MIGRSVCLKAVDADFIGHVKVPAGIRPKRLNVAVIAFRLAAKQFVSASRRGWIETVVGGLGRRYRQLIELKGLELRCDLIVIRADILTIGKFQISETVCCGDRKLRGVIQPWIPESAGPMHLQIRYEGVPMGNRTPTGPSVKIHSA